MTAPSEQNEEIVFGTVLKRWLPLLAGLWLVVYVVSFFSQEMPNSGNSRMDVILLLPEIFAGLLFRQPPAHVPTGWGYLAQRVEILIWAGLILAAAFCAGRLLLRGLKLVDLLDRAERTALAGGIGLSLLSLFTLLCGVTGLLHRGLFLSAFAILIAVEGWFCRPGRDRSPPHPEGPRSAGPEPGVEQSAPRWVKLLCLAVCVPFLMIMLLGALLPSTDFDVKAYHLQAPKEFFLNGRVGFLPHNVYASFPFLTEMLSLAGMVTRGDWYFGALVGKAVLMSFAPITALGVYSVTRRIGGETAGWLAATVCLSTPWTYRISIIAYTEGALCCYVILTLLGFILSQRWTGSPGETARPNGAILLTGLLAGSATATKYPGLVLVAIPFAVAVGGFAWLKTAKPQAVMRGMMLYGLGVLVTFGPWMTKNFVETGNPVYPLMASLFGVAGWDDELAERWRAGHRPPVEVLRDPTRWPGDLKQSVLDVAVRNDWQSSLLFGLAPLALLFSVPSRGSPGAPAPPCEAPRSGSAERTARGKRRRELLLVTGYALWILMVWYGLTHRIDRFWVPVIPVLSVLSGIGLVTAWGCHGSASRAPSGPQTRHTLPTHASPAGRRRARLTEPWHPVMAIPAGLLFGFTLLYNFAFNTTGLGGYNQYLIDYAAARRLTLPEGGTKTPSIAVIDRLDLPDDALVLFVGEAQVFDAAFPHRYHTVFNQSLLEQIAARKRGPGEWELLDADRIRRNLKDQGVTHLFVNWNEVLRYRLTYGYSDFISPQRLRELEKRGVLTPIPLAPEWSLRGWDRLNEGEQREVLRWGGELKEQHLGRETFRQFELYTARGDH